MGPCLKLKRFLAKPENEDDTDSELEQNTSRRDSLQKIQRIKQNIYSFMARILIAKICQRLVIAAYLAYTVYNPRIYSYVPTWVVCVPLAIWITAFVWVHNVKAAPSLSISVAVVVAMGLCVGYMIGEIYKHIHLYFLFLPATALCLLLTNICFVPFCIFTKLRPNLKSVYFHLIPQLINTSLNAILIVIWSGLINKGKISISEDGFDARSKSDAVLLVVVPTLFWSFSFTLLMSTRIQAIVEGRIFRVSRWKRDYVFAAAFFI